jgi:hypothetical protein
MVPAGGRPNAVPQHHRRLLPRRPRAGGAVPCAAGRHCRHPGSGPATLQRLPAAEGGVAPPPREELVGPHGGAAHPSTRPRRPEADRAMVHHPAAAAAGLGPAVPLYVPHASAGRPAPSAGKGLKDY